MKWRINLIFIFIFLFSAVLVGKLFFIQVQQDDLYKALAQGLYVLPSEKLEERGEIYFKNGESLAINWNWPLVFASPPKVEEPEKTADILSEILNLDKSFILEKLQGENLYALIKNRLNQEELEVLKTKNLDGVYLGEERGRYYPQETLASQLVGFLGAGGTGQYGLEERYDEILHGSSQGTNLTLTLDYDIQFLAEKLLEKAKENLEIEGGEIIVVDPYSGKILAMANFPNFNPNQYKEYALKEELEIFQNGITQKIFEPGSVFKPITMAAALNEGKITPETAYLDPGVVEFDGWPIYNYEQRIYRGETTAEITMTEVLEKSVNTGAVFAEQQLGRELFFEYIEKFGIFEPTGIDLQETCPENKEFHEGWEQGREINFATASYGQGIEMTPIQLIRAYSAIANGGKLVTPYLVESEREPQESQPIISPKTATQLTAMLISVVENGYAKAARIPGYYVAGKTGTAQVPEGGGYSAEKTIQTFVGFAPAFDPQFLILVKLNNPQTKTAEYSAVPIFHTLAEDIIHHYQVPPDYQVD